MGRYEKEWSAQWNGHIIRVENRVVKRGHFETHLTVDGALIQQYKGDCWHPNIGCAGEFEDETGNHNIQVKSAFSDSAAAICHIYVDDELIGGDVQKPLPFTEEDIAQLPVAEQKKRLKQMLLRQLVIGFILCPLILALVGSLFDVTPIQYFTFGMTLIFLVLNVVPTAYKLFKLSLQNPDKNSTPV